MREVLHTPQTFLRSPLTEVIEHDSRSNRHHHFILALVQNLNEVDLRVQDSTFEIISKKQIAAPADMKHRACKLIKLDIDKIRHRVILHETTCLHLHAEGVHLSQILIVLRPYHIFSSPVKPGMTLCLTNRFQHRCRESPQA